MPTKIPNPLIFWIAKVTNRPVAHALEFLKAENETMRSQFTKPPTTTPAQRQRLLKLAKPLGASVRNLLTIVSYTTFLRWQRDAEKKPMKAAAKKTGRPKTSEAISEIVLRFARDNALDGVFNGLRGQAVFQCRSSLQIRVQWCQWSYSPHRCSLQSNYHQNIDRLIVEQISP